MENRAALHYISDAFRHEPRVIRQNEDKTPVRFKVRQAKPAPKSGGLCLTCRMKKSVMGQCGCDY